MREEASGSLTSGQVSEGLLSVSSVDGVVALVGAVALEDFFTLKQGDKGLVLSKYGHNGGVAVVEGRSQQGS